MKMQAVHEDSLCKLDSLHAELSETIRQLRESFPSPGEEERFAHNTPLQAQETIRIQVPIRSTTPRKPPPTTTTTTDNNSSSDSADEHEFARTTMTPRTPPLTTTTTTTVTTNNNNNSSSSVAEPDVASQLELVDDLDDDTSSVATPEVALEHPTYVTADNVSEVLAPILQPSLQQFQDSLTTTTTVTTNNNNNSSSSAAAPDVAPQLELVDDLDDDTSSVATPDVALEHPTYVTTVDDLDGSTYVTADNVSEVIASILQPIRGGDQLFRSLSCPRL